MFCLWKKSPEERIKALIGWVVGSILLNRAVVVLGESLTDSAHLYDFVHGLSFGLLAFSVVAMVVAVLQLRRQKEEADG